MITIYCPKCGCFHSENQLPSHFNSYVNLNCKECNCNFKIELTEPLTIDCIISMLKEDKKIHAIKRVRDQMGWGLRESKDYVDLIAALHDKRTYHLEVSYYKPE